METTCIIPTFGLLEISSIAEVHPTFGPFTLEESKQFEVKKDVKNLSSCVPVFYIDVEMLNFVVKFSSISDIFRTLGISTGCSSYRLKNRNVFKYLGRKTVLFREEDLTREDLITESVSREQFNKIILSAKTRKEKRKPINFKVKSNYRKGLIDGVCIVDVLGNIIDEFPNVSTLSSSLGISFGGVYKRISFATVFTYNEKKVFIIFKSEIPEKSKIMQKLTNDHIKSVMSQGVIELEKRNYHIRLKNGWSCIKPRAHKQDLVENFREQHSETKEFKRETRLEETLTCASKIIRKYQDGKLIEEILENPRIATKSIVK